MTAPSTPRAQGRVARADLDVYLGASARSGFLLQTSCLLALALVEVGFPAKK